MRILALNDEPIQGGAAQLFRRTNQILKGAGHDVIEVTGHTLAEASTSHGTMQAEMPGNPVRRAFDLVRSELRLNVRQVYAPRLVRNLTEQLRRRRVDVAHVHNIHTHLSTHLLPALKRLGIPIVYQVNDYFFFCNAYSAYNRRLAQPCKRCITGNVFSAVRYGCVSDSGKNRVDRACVQALKRLALALTKPWRCVDVFLVTSDQASSLLEEWGIPRERHVKLLNAMSREEFEFPTRLGDEIMFYGTCAPNKGTETFLQALEHVEPTSRLGVYLMDMTPRYQARLQQVATRRGLQLHIDSTLRWHNGLRDRVALARAVIVPSQWWVTSENVVYEAMLLGKPVIVSRIGGNTELVDHGQTGFLFEPGDEQALARYINVLAQDAGLASRLGEQAMAQMSRRAEEGVFLKRLEAAYHTAIRSVEKEPQRC